eukprot:827844-Pyramimonas_sp.AAC.1
MYEESEADLEAHIMEVWCVELHGERELREATPLDDTYTVPTHMNADNSVLVTVAEEQWGHLPKEGTPTRLLHREDVSCPTMLHGRRPQLRIGLRRKRSICRILLRGRNVKRSPIRATAQDIRCRPCNHHASICYRRCKAS